MEGGEAGGMDGDEAEGWLRQRAYSLPGFASSLTGRFLRDTCSTGLLISSLVGSLDPETCLQESTGSLGFELTMCPRCSLVSLASSLRLTRGVSVVLFTGLTPLKLPPVHLPDVTLASVLIWLPVEMQLIDGVR